MKDNPPLFNAGGTLMDFSIEVRNKDGLRTLHFESQCTQGAMRVGHPDELVLEYTRVMMAALLLRAEDFPRKVLLIGLGAGSLAKFLYRHRPQAHLTAVEISPRVVDIARTQFDLPTDPERLRIVVGDGYQFMHEDTGHYDLILVDGFNEHAHPGDLNTLPFYQACRERLSGQGILAVNLIGLCHGVKGGFAHIETAFDNRAIRFPKCKSGNTIAFATAGEPVELALTELEQRVHRLKAQTRLDLSDSVNRLGNVPECEQGRLTL